MDLSRSRRAGGGGGGGGGALVVTVICVVQARLLRLNLANCDMGRGTEEFFLGGGYV